jgi:hypothetical protein
MAMKGPQERRHVGSSKLLIRHLNPTESASEGNKGAKIPVEGRTLRWDKRRATVWNKKRVDLDAESVITKSIHPMQGAARPVPPRRLARRDLATDTKEGRTVQLAIRHRE